MSHEDDVRERLIRIEEKVTSALVIAADHETRLRGLEESRWPLKKVGTVIALVTLVVTVVALLMK